MSCDGVRTMQTRGTGCWTRPGSSVQRTQSTNQPTNRASKASPGWSHNAVTMKKKWRSKSQKKRGREYFFITVVDKKKGGEGVLVKKKEEDSIFVVVGKDK